MENNEQLLLTKQAELDSILDAALDELDDDGDDSASDRSSSDNDVSDNDEDDDKLNGVHENKPIFGPQIPPPTTKEGSSSPSRNTPASSKKDDVLASPEEEAIKDMMRHMEALFPPDKESLKSSTEGREQTKERNDNIDGGRSVELKSTISAESKSQNKTKQRSKKTPTTTKSSKKAPVGDNEKVEETMTKLLEQLSKSFDGDGNDFDNDQFPGFDGFGDDFMKEIAKEWESTMSANNDEDQEEVVGQVVNGMMKQLLSKEFMYEPMKDICDSFPSWLAENKSKLNEKEYEQYGKQYQYFQRIVHVYEHDPDNVARLTELMHDIQEFGQPPPELIKKLAPDLEFDQNGIPNMDGTDLGPMMNEECCIM